MVTSLKKASILRYLLLSSIPEKKTFSMLSSSEVIQLVLVHGINPQCIGK